MQGLIETYKHIRLVQHYLNLAAKELLRRGEVHDDSKLLPPEADIFEEFTGKLKASTYGSDEYKSFLAAMKPALDHHYANNDHHPEHESSGIRGMSLFSLTEMFLDWKAATTRHADGDIRKSIELNQKRFGYSDELKDILLNTADALDELEKK